MLFDVVRCVHARSDVATFCLFSFESGLAESFMLLSLVDQPMLLSLKDCFDIVLQFLYQLTVSLNHLHVLIKRRVDVVCVVSGLMRGLLGCQGRSCGNRRRLMRRWNRYISLSRWLDKQIFDVLCFMIFMIGSTISLGNFKFCVDYWRLISKQFRKTIPVAQYLTVLFVVLCSELENIHSEIVEGFKASLVILIPSSYSGVPIVHG